MQNKQSIYSNRCWIGGKLTPATVTFEDGLITGIFQQKTTNTLDVGDDILMPGVIDAHVHINEPGRTDWEGFETATQAAAAGGITTVIDMPLNSKPVTITVHALKEKLAASINKLYVNCGFYGGLVPGNQDHIEPLIRANVMGIKCFLTHSGIDEFPNVGERELDIAMPLIAKHNNTILAHCEMFTNDKTGSLQHPGSYKDYLASRPKKWENDAVELMIQLCRKHTCRTHIVHVSSAEALKMIASAKEEGLPLTAETCSHYIYFNAENIPDNNTLYKCAPPIREKENNQLLIEALLDGVLDFITSDHSPAPPGIKELTSGDLNKAWGGIAGLQFLLPASWTALRMNMSLEQFIPLLTFMPARFLNLHSRKGKINIGYDADLVIWRPEESFEVRKEDIRHRHKISPYIGESLFGTIQTTIVNGQLVYDKKLIKNTKHGRVILNKL